jgi:hypothetical protein
MGGVPGLPPNSVVILRGVPCCTNCGAQYIDPNGQAHVGPLPMAYLHPETDDEGYLVKVWHCTSCGAKTATRVSRDHKCSACGHVDQEWVKGGPGKGHRPQAAPTEIRAPIGAFRVGR